MFSASIGRNGAWRRMGRDLDDFKTDDLSFLFPTVYILILPLSLTAVPQAGRAPDYAIASTEPGAVGKFCHLR